jgi:hypothetical protein
MRAIRAAVSLLISDPVACCKLHGQTSLGFSPPPRISRCMALGGFATDEQAYGVEEDNVGLTNTKRWAQGTIGGNLLDQSFGLILFCRTRFILSNQHRSGYALAGRRFRPQRIRPRYKGLSRALSFRPARVRHHRHRDDGRAQRGRSS